jgi:hypothetical protein
VVGRLRGGWCGKDSNGREGIGGEVAITNETATMPTCGAMSDLGQTGRISWVYTVSVEYKSCEFKIKGFKFIESKGEKQSIC